MKRRRRRDRSVTLRGQLVTMDLHCPYCSHREIQTLEVGDTLACPRCHLFEGRIRWLKGRVRK